MLNPIPEARVTAEKALSFPWFQQQLQNPISIDPAVITQLRRFKARSKMQIQAMHILVNHLDVSDLKELRTLFNRFDANGTGRLSFGEIQA
jgi:hypothetical protein